MQPHVADILAGLPADLDQDESNTPALAELVARLAHRPVPTGRLSRLWILGSLQARIAAAYFAHWLRSGFADAERRQASLNETHLRAALKLLGGMGYLRGAIMKCGQTLSHWPDVVPAQFADSLALLQFEAPPMHFALLREFVHDELGGDPQELFAEFETEAFAAASLGQVHRARLHTGERVAVKIQYPNIARTIRSDFKNMCVLLAPMRLGRDWENLMSQMDDIRTMLDLETDYLHEAELTRHAASCFREGEGIVVPRVHERFTTPHVLTPDLLEGEHLPAFLAGEPDDAERTRRAEQILLTIYRLFYTGRLIYADPHPGNYLFLPDGRLGLLDFGCCRRMEGTEWDYMVLAGEAMLEGGDKIDRLGAMSTDVDDVTQLDPGHRQLVEDLAQWIWEPMLHEGPFDFSDPEYFRRGIELTGVIFRKRYMRSRPTNTWLSRHFFGVRALMHRLGARADMKRIHEAEVAH